MIARGLAIVFCALLMLRAGPAHALVLFGTSEDVHFIQDVGLTGPEGEPLFLGYKTTTSYFVGGVAFSDDGYILAVRASPDHILDLPEGEALRSFQTRGLLPSPLPAYSVNVFEYVRGFSLWIVIVLLGGTYLAVFLSRRGNRRLSGY